MNVMKLHLFTLLAATAVILLPIAAWADLPLVIESFPPLDPNGGGGPPGYGTEFFIGPVVGEVTPDLEFGVLDRTFEPIDPETGLPTAPPPPTFDTLMMSWGPPNPLSDDQTWEAEAGWELVFGEDPDLVGGQITLSINPPGNMDAAGNFVGIKSVSIVAIDVGNNVAGGWGFNTDQLGTYVPADDPLATGGVSLVNNVMHSVTINIGAGPTPECASVTGPFGTFIAPNFLIPGNNNFANIVSLQFFENGVLQGSTVVVPNQPIPRLLNYWDSVTVKGPTLVPITPAPSILWPPNHKMVPVLTTVKFGVPVPGLTPFVSVLSSEPDDGDGDGNTTGDVNGQPAHPFPANLSANFVLDATGATTGVIDLRAERSGDGRGRTYTIVVSQIVINQAGLLDIEAGVCTVRVPHDQSHKNQKKK